MLIQASLYSESVKPVLLLYHLCPALFHLVLFHLALWLLLLPLSYRGKFYAVGVDVSDNSRFLYMRKRRYIIPCRIVERFRKSIGLDQYLDNLPVSEVEETEDNEEKEAEDEV